MLRRVAFSQVNYAARHCWASLSPCSLCRCAFSQKRVGLELSLPLVLESTISACDTSLGNSPCVCVGTLTTAEFLTCCEPIGCCWHFCPYSCHGNEAWLSAARIFPALLFPITLECTEYGVRNTDVWLVLIPTGVQYVQMALPMHKLF